MGRIAAAALVLLGTGCSTCSMWDECDPGDEQSCAYEGCMSCRVARQVCRDNHEWGPCECMDRGEPDSYDVPFPEIDTMFDLPLDDREDLAEDEDRDLEYEDVGFEDLGIAEADVEEDDPPVDEDEP